MPILAGSWGTMSRVLSTVKVLTSLRALALLPPSRFCFVSLWPQAFLFVLFFGREGGASIPGQSMITRVALSSPTVCAVENYKRCVSSCCPHQALHRENRSYKDIYGFIRRRCSPDDSCRKVRFLVMLQSQREQSGSISRARKVP